MQRFLLFFSLFFGGIYHLHAQSITWVTPCEDKVFCLNPGSCTEGNVYLVEKAVTTCGGGLVSYSHKIDLFNNGSIDIQSGEDTINQAFPVGTHQIIWRANDNCGNISTACTYLFTVKDCSPPNLLCINGLTQNLEYPECEASFYASDFILNVNDNCTPVNQLEFGMREAGTGTGFPSDTSLTFGICEKGLHVLHIWVRDGNNLANQCNSYVLVQENNGLCECNIEGDLTLKGCARTPDSAKVETYTIRTELNGTPLQGQPFFLPQQKTIPDSCFSITYPALPLNGNYTGSVRAQRYGDPLTGVSTFDLVLINKHILGQQPLENFYQVFAADVNQSQTITTFDIIETRKLILGIYDTFPHTPPWRFILPVPNPANLTDFAAVRDTYPFTIGNLMSDTLLSGFNFVGVKMGDANSNASLLGMSDRGDGGAALVLQTEDLWLNTGETRWISLLLPEAVQLDGWQLALQADVRQLDILDVRGAPSTQLALFDSGALRISRVSDTPLAYHPGAPLVSLLVSARKPVQLSEALKLDATRLQPEVYPTGTKATVRPLQFRIGRQTSAQTSFFPPQPNPFSDETVFGAELSTAAAVTLEIFNLNGQLVFQSTQQLEAGSHKVRLPGAALPGAGVWIYRISTGEAVASGRLIRL